jgi:hypothetical protein
MTDTVPGTGRYDETAKKKKTVQWRDQPNHNLVTTTEMETMSPKSPKDSVDGEPSTQIESSSGEPSTQIESSSNRCAQCSKRFAVKECAQAACTLCCSDEACEKHKRLREQADWKEQVMSGTTWVQSEARLKRSKLLKPGRFREPGFVYQGDTVVIWSLRDYIRNPKWREDALRMTDVELTQKLCQPRRNRRKLFHRMMENLYRKSLEETSKSASSKKNRG